MNCPQVQERLTDYALDEASAFERLAIDEHVVGCAPCAGELEALRLTAGMLRGMKWPEAPSALTADRREKLEPRAFARPGVSWSRIGLMAAASLVVVGVAAMFLAPSLPGARVAVDRLPDPYVAPSAAPPVEPARVAEVPKPAKPEARTGRVEDEKAVPKLTKATRENLRALGYLGERSVDGDGKGDKNQRAKQAVEVVASASKEQVAPMASGVPGGVAGGVVGGQLDSAGEQKLAERALRMGAHGAGLRRPSDRRPRNTGPHPRAMFFEHKGTNPFVRTSMDPLSTFGLDVDTASYAVARSYLGRGTLPPPDAVRVEEFINALPQDYEAPSRGAFAIHLEGSPNPFHPGYHLLRIGLKAREVRARDRKPAVLTFVIDVSGSMNMENRLGLVKRSLRLLVERLGERDRIGIVVYGSRGRIVLDPTPASERDEILGAIQSLRPEGSTNLEEGLDLGYEMALRALDPEATNRVVLCTDGVANNGITDAETLLERIHEQSEKRVFMTALGFGMGNYNDALLQRLADEGDGQYAYIDDFQEAERFFLRDLTGILEVVARDAKAQVAFDPGRVESYRLLGYEKRDVADEDFRNDRVDGGEVGPGHTVTALYELRLTGVGGGLGEVHVRYQDPDAGGPREQREEIDRDRLHDRFHDATPWYRMTVVAARFAEHLRESHWVRGEPLERVIGEAERLPRSFLRTAEAAELLDLMRRAAALARPRS